MSLRCRPSRFRRLLAVAIFAVLPVAGVSASVAGETLACRFPKAGLVILDTREPGASITLGGVRHAAQSGAYFHQSADGQIALLHRPGIKRVTLVREGMADERATRCSKRPNRR